MDDKRGRIISMEQARRNKRIPNRKSRVISPPTNIKRPGGTTASLTEHKRGKSIDNSTKFVAGLFFIVVVIYLVRTVAVFATRPEIPVNTITMGTVDVIHKIEGIIIRDETVYSAQRDGVLQFNVRDLERVQPGSMVASIQNVQAVTDTMQSISHVEEDIMRLQDIQGDLSAVDPVVQQINRQIQNMVDSRLSNHIQLNMSDAFALRDSINQSIGIRNQMIISDNLDRNIRAELGINYQILMGRLDENLQTVTIGAGGILAPIVDGFESDLTFESMYYLSVEDTRQNVDFDKLIPRREVEFGDEIFKIVNSNIWYIAAYVPNDLIDGFAEGQNRNLFIENRNPISVRVHHIDHGFNESFVIFRSNAYMTDFLDTRSIFFRTSDTIQYGLRIANSAIIELDHLAIPLSAVHEGDERYVLRLIGYDYEKILLAVIDQDDNYVYILANHEVLALGSTLIERENVNATQMISRITPITGVFRVNTGIASFVPITLPEDGLGLSFGGGMYSILDPDVNPGLRVHDHIVTNASLVEDGDIIFSGVR